MPKHILITGGAGFIGSHLADDLLKDGHRVRALDNLSVQVHGPGLRRPEHLAPEVELVTGDVRNADAVRRALKGIDAVFHLAAMSGVGQSMYDVETYTGVNVQGTSVLMQEIVARPVEKVVLASCLGVYGEGLYRFDGRVYTNVSRGLEQLRRGDWNPRNAEGEELDPLPTPETKPTSPVSIYALSKLAQEQTCLLLGSAYRIPVTALRLANVYGPRQALSNPYAGVLSVFASRALNDNPPLLFEDGEQTRDFLYVRDAVRALRLAMDGARANGLAINAGSGRAHSLRHAAHLLLRVMGKPRLWPKAIGKHRTGDVRHCIADIALAREVLGFEPQTDLDAGFAEFAAWLEGRDAYDRVDRASAELVERGLTV